MGAEALCQFSAQHLFSGTQDMLHNMYEHRHTLRANKIVSLT